jgi:hypothetical protein
MTAIGGSSLARNRPSFISSSVSSSARPHPLNVERTRPNVYHISDGRNSVSATAGFDDIGGRASARYTAAKCFFDFLKNRNDRRRRDDDGDAVARWDPRSRRRVGIPIERWTSGGVQGVGEAGVG